MSRPAVRAASGAMAAALAASLVFAGCDPQPPTDDHPTVPTDNVTITSADAQDAVLALADEAATALAADTQADFTENTALGPSRSWDCSSSPAATGQAVQWAADRRWVLESGDATADMLDSLVDHFVDQGWEVTEDETEGRRFVRLVHDGYMLDMTGEQAARSGQPTQLGVTVYSPCLATGSD